jgi:thymidylate synthase
MNSLDKQYTDLLQDILDNGVLKEDRTGTGTISVFGRQIRHKMSEGFPLLTTKKMPFKTITTELLWFLRGDTNIKYLVDNGCNIWNGDAYKNYEKWYDNEVVNLPFDKPKRFTQEEFIKAISLDDDFAKKWGELGPIYGKQWRTWDKFIYDVYDRENKSSFKVEEVQIIDQIQNLINDLKTNPDSRRLMVNAWNVGELDQMVLPPCHYGFQVYTRELSLNERGELFRKTYPNKSVDEFKPNGMEIQSMTHQLDTRYNNANIPNRTISLMWNQRSVDTFLGLPFNIASYGLLLEIIAKEVNMVPGELIGNLGDVHLYSNHIDQAREQIGRDLTNEERYNIWFSNNYETGMERFFNPNELPDFDNEYYEPTPKRTREPYPLPEIEISGSWKFLSSSPCFADTIEYKDIKLENYQSHPGIKAPLSN